MPDARPLLTDAERYTVRLEPQSRGGGAKFHPRTLPEARAHLLPQARMLATRVAGLSEDLRGPRVIFFATLLPNYLANTYYPRQLLAHLDLVPLGSIRTKGVLQTATRIQEDVPTKTLILAGDDASIAALTTLLEGTEVETTPKQAQADLLEVDDLRMPGVADVVGATGPEDSPLGLYEAVLHPDSEGSGLVRGPVDDETFQKLTDLVEREEGEVLAAYRRVIGGLTFVPLRLATRAVPAVAAFNPLRSLRPLPPIRPLPAPLMRAAATIPPPNATDRPRRASPVALFDGGVDASTDYFSRWVTPTDLTPNGPSPEGLSHGTRVTSAFLYGHLGGVTRLPEPPSPLHHYRVLPSSDPRIDPDAYVLLDQISNAVRGAIPYDIVSLSLGPYESVDDLSAPSRWTATLDEIAYEKRVLFVVAAGNNGLDDPTLGLNRVQLPGDMVNALSVGACDVPEPRSPWDRTDYSAVGPGRAGGRIQPAGVAFGGTGHEPFEWVSPAGSLGGTAGTSFAAPLAAGGLAGLAARLGNRSTPEVLRALAVHVAERVSPPRYVEVGHGRLRRDYDAALDSEQNCVTVLYQGSAERNRVDRLLVPFPGGIPDASRVRISWTLSYLSPTDPAEAAEYTKASLDLVFRPNQFIHTVTEEGRSRAVDLRTDVEDVRAVLASGGTLSEHPRSRAASGGPEVGRREEGKWETVRHDEVGVLARNLARPVLDLTYLAREAGSLVATAPPLPYALVVSIETRRDVDLYERVRADFPLLVQLQLTARSRLQT